MKWIEKILHEPPELESLLNIIFGKLEMKDNLRVINTLTVIAKQVFDVDYEKNTVQGLTAFGQDETYFSIIFKMIMRSQTQNRNFENAIIRGMVFKVRKLYGEFLRETQDREIPEDERLAKLSVVIKRAAYDAF